MSPGVGPAWRGTARRGAVPAVEGAHPPPPNKKTKPSEAAAQTVEKGCGGAAPPAGAEAEEEDEDQEKEKEKEKASEASSVGVLAKYRSKELCVTTVINGRTLTLLLPRVRSCFLDSF
jgi:hypothetical protein